MKPPLAMLTYSLFFCNRTASVSKGRATACGPSCCSWFTHLQEMCQHHVHIHVLLLPPTSHEAQVLPAGNGAWLQRLLLCLQERLDRQSELGGVLEHLRAGGKKPCHVRAVDSVSLSLHCDLESVFLVPPGQSPDERLWTGARNCTVLQADNPPRRIGPHPEREIHYLNNPYACGETHQGWVFDY